MKKIISILVFVMIAIPILNIYAGDTANDTVPLIQADTLNATTHVDTYIETDDFTPGLGLFALIAIMFISVCVGVGIIFTVLLLLALFGLVSAGILSTSIIVGLYKKSYEKGFKAFLVLTSTVCGLIICGAGFWVLNKISHWWSVKAAIIIGAVFGLLAGFIFGLFCFIILKGLAGYFKKQLHLK